MAPARVSLFTEWNGFAQRQAPPYTWISHLLTCPQIEEVLEELGFKRLINSAYTELQVAQHLAICAISHRKLQSKASFSALQRVLASSSDLTPMLRDDHVV